MRVTSVAMLAVTGTLFLSSIGDVARGAGDSGASEAPTNAAGQQEVSADRSHPARPVPIEEVLDGVALQSARRLDGMLGRMVYRSLTDAGDGAFDARRFRLRVQGHW